MGLYSVSVFERILLRAVIPVCVVSGIIVATGFFFPALVGDVISGEWWLVVSLLFFGSGLIYFALLPTDRTVADEYDPAVTLRVRSLRLLDTVTEFLAQQDRIAFGIPVGIFFAFFCSYLIAPDGTVATIATMEGLITTYFGWVFVGTTILTVAFCLYLLIGPWGSIKLGGPETEPTYTYPVYFTMFFTAGIAAGIVFWGPAEALFHYDSPPPFFAAEPRSEAAITAALAYAIFHWGFTAWSAYVIIGVPIAYFVYRHGAPLRVSSLLVPFLGVENLDSLWSRSVDALAIFATIGGVGTSVALVSEQFLTGINYQWDVGYNSVSLLLFVIGLIIVFVASAQSGVDRGIRRIAAVNVVLFVAFGVLLLTVAPRDFLVASSSAAIGSYIVNFVPMSLQISGQWVAEWTLWNWAWWFSWAPFAGLFLAALSRGRRIRTVVITGFVATSLATVVWFLLLSSTALYFQHGAEVDVLAAIDAHGGSEAVAGFPVFEALPLGELFMFLFLALILAFMTTSADTSTLVVSVLATERDLAPTTGAIVFWGVFQGIVAIAVLATGSAETLQAMAVLAGGPFAIVALVATAGLVRWFHRHERDQPWPFASLWSAIDAATLEKPIDTDAQRNSDSEDEDDK
ncbi:BCCT family transporter [Halorubrum vacuolatum]|uniref:Choline/carnitine/betaine transport n=1 Tax=Halorubrum vacuolatum TaxID=63740 RepID=A0A238XZJ8_HALVU|nr:BCCT family transporter [Halorubrum vacuolatum]SNR64415.1 choline/carnitine/betaine transport [Halorubrum vacuolatum]